MDWNSFTINSEWRVHSLKKEIKDTIRGKATVFLEKEVAQIFARENSPNLQEEKKKRKEIYALTAMIRSIAMHSIMPEQNMYDVEKTSIIEIVLKNNIKAEKKDMCLQSSFCIIDCVCLCPKEIKRAFVTERSPPIIL